MSRILPEIPFIVVEKKYKKDNYSDEAFQSHEIAGKAVSIGIVNYNTSSVNKNVDRFVIPSNADIEQLVDLFKNGDDITLDRDYSYYDVGNCVDESAAD